MTLFELWFSQGICPVVGLLGMPKVSEKTEEDIKFISQADAQHREAAIVNKKTTNDKGW